MALVKPFAAAAAVFRAKCCGKLATEGSKTTSSACGPATPKGVFARSASALAGVWGGPQPAYWNIRKGYSNTLLAYSPIGQRSKNKKFLRCLIFSVFLTLFILKGKLIFAFDLL